MRDFFQKQLHENECSVEGLIDWKSPPISPYHNLQCEISDWTHCPCQVFVTDVERSFLDEGLGVGWEPSDVETHFGPMTITSKKRESDQQKKCIQESMKNNAEELVIKESLYQIKLKRGIGKKKKIYVCTCNFEPLFERYADANTKYAELWKTDKFEISPAIVTRLLKAFVIILEKKFAWTELPQPFRDMMKSEVQRYRNEELISLVVYSWPASSPPIFKFLMKSGNDSTAVTPHYSPYEHIRDDFSHEASILDNVTGVFNVGSPSVIRIGYGKKSKNKKSKEDEDCQVVHGKNGFCPSPSRWANPISDVENTRRNCAEGSIANLLYHLGNTTLYHSILLSMNQTEASVIYKIATGCTLNDSVTMPRAVVEGHFRDPIMKCLWILELSEKYFYKKIEYSEVCNVKGHNDQCTLFGTPYYFGIAK